MTSSIQYIRENNPWYSFKPYQESDANSFKGRGKDVAEVMKSIVRNNFVVCYAKSGIGKSSLINAGLMPRLRKKQILPIPIKFTEDFFEDEEVHNLDDSTAQRSTESAKKDKRGEKYVFEEKIRNQINFEIQKLNESAAEDKRDEKYVIERHPSIGENELMMAINRKMANMSIWWWLSTHQIICKRGEFDIVYQPILIFDQFEELFQKTQTEGQRDKFFNWLQEMSLVRPSDEIQKDLQKIQNDYPNINVSLPQNCGWKILLSLREDYVGLLDYWCIQRIRIPAVQDNRYCLMPLTKEQAEEVITQQTIDGHRVDILDKYKQTIIDSLEDTDGVPAVLLSVLCNRIYDEEIKGNTNTARRLQHMTSSVEISDDAVKTTVRSLIRSVYEERIKETKIPNRKVRKIEQALVRDNGTRRRLEIGELPEKLQAACEKLADSYLIRIDNFGEKKGEKIQYVEIIHDRVAEVIADKRHEINKKNKVLWSRGALVAGIILLFGFTYWNQLWTKSKYKVNLYPYMEWVDQTYKVNASAPNYKGQCENLWNLQTLICDTNAVVVSNCPMLETIDANDYNQKKLSLKISNCDNLKYVNFNESIKELSLEISGCPLILQIELPDMLESLDLRILSNQISFKISKNSSFFVWNNGILWDIQKDSILYARYDVPMNIDVPFGTNHQKYKYEPRIFSVQNMPSVTLPNHNGDIDRNIKFLDLSADSISKIPAGLFKGFKNLKSVKFPSSRHITIKKEAFYGCDNLETIDFGTSSYSICENAFANCNSLIKVQFPDSVEIERGAFKDCRLIEEIIFGEQASIYDYSFGRCISLKEVRLPNRTKIFSPNSFVGCLNIEKFDYESLYWETANDGTILQKGTKHPILLTNKVQFHTYKDSIYQSKNGVLCYGNRKFNEPIAKVQQNILFVNNGEYYINNTDNSAIIFFPLRGLVRMSDGSFDLIPLFVLPTNLAELHLPFSNGINLSSINNLVPASIKANVTLYVPYGCLRYFINHPSYKDFKDIKEEKFFDSLWYIIKYHFETGLSVVNYYGFWTMIAIIVVVVTIVLAWFMYYKKRKEEGTITKKDVNLLVLKAFGTTILGPLFWYVFYWFLYLTILPLLHLKEEIYSSTPLFISTGIAAGLLSLLSVYIILYSNGFNFNGFLSSAKNNWEIIKHISIAAYKNPQKTIKFFSLILLPFIIYFAFVQYQKYKEEKLQEAIVSINEKINLASQHPDGALGLYYDVWKENYNTIKNKDIEQTLCSKVYSALIKEALADTCFDGVRSDFLMMMPDGKLLFSDNSWNDKTCMLKEKKDSVHLIEDSFDFYKVDTSGKYIAFGNNYSVMVMDLMTQQIDTISAYISSFDFHPHKPLLAYAEYTSKSIRFYDIERKKNANIKPIYTNYDIEDFCYDKNGGVIIPSSRDNAILYYHWGDNKWENPDSIKIHSDGGYYNPLFVTKDVFSIHHNDSLIIWENKNIGKNERCWKGLYNKPSENSFSSDGRFAITFNIDELQVLDLSVSEKIYVTIELPGTCRAACFSKDGKSIYIAYDRVIARVPILSPEQVYKKLKEIVDND